MFTKRKKYATILEQKGGKKMEEEIIKLIIAQNAEKYSKMKFIPNVEKSNIKEEIHRLLGIKEYIECIDNYNPRTK